MLIGDLRLNTRLLGASLPLIKARYLDLIDCFEVGLVEVFQPVCVPFIQSGDYN